MKKQIQITVWEKPGEIISTWPWAVPVLPVVRA